MSDLLRRVAPADVGAQLRHHVAADTLAKASTIVEDVRRGGEEALRHHSERLGDLAAGETIVVDRGVLKEAYEDLNPDVRLLLERAAGRIRDFAEAQRGALDEVDVEVLGGRAGHSWIPVSTVGAYAPGGRHHLPSSVLMTVVPARVAGVGRITVASPKPNRVTLAAAYLAGADQLLAVGGAQAVAALAFGIQCPASDLVVGPGNRWVTAAKKHLFGEIGIDGLAGPSEIVVVADESADPRLVAADLLAQAEHDIDALPILVTDSLSLAARVEDEIHEQLESLTTAADASKALKNGFCVIVATLDEAVALSDKIAPEHLALHITDPHESVTRFNSYGSIFVGGHSAETFADYGIGPNHVLPTGGGARFQSGLSVMTFLRSPTWLHVTDPTEIIADTTALARIEGLEGHARAADFRRPETTNEHT